MKIARDQAVELADTLRNSLKIQNEIEFGDIKGKAPDINFYPDEVLYFDPARQEIHLGIFGIVDIFNVESEEEFISGVNFGRGHESQHRRSTATVPYQWGITRGVEMVLEYISAREEKTKRRFRTNADYEEFANRVLPSMGIYISYRMLSGIIGGIANSIEDGRIERIRSNRFPGFEKMRLYFRGKFWMTQEREYKLYTEIKDNAAEKLQVIMDQILSLATCQLYAKGFVAVYTGTPLMDEIKSIMPYIAKGIMAGRTRDMAFQVIEIAKLLAPYIYESCKMGQTDINARKVIEKVLADMIKSMIDNMPDTGLGEIDEDTDDGSANSTFQNTDLVITLDDETYDKLVKNSKSSKDGNGLMIKREHPKEIKKKDENESEDTGKDIKTNTDQTGIEESKSKQGEECSNGNDSKNNSGVGSGTLEEVKKAMQEAAESTNEMAKKQIDSINRSDIHARKTQGSVVSNSDKAITSEDVKGICPQFKELRREYKLKDRLPPVLAAQARTLYRKNKKYFKSLSTPNVSYLDSGSVDPSRIYGLSFGDTDIFRKKGIDRKFDGCAYILIDNSGSMSGAKRVEACKAAALIEESYRGLIPIKIVAFDSCGTVIHEVVKGWDEQQNLNCCWNFCLHGREGGGNEDQYDILIAQKELLARSERKKLLIVLSDGAPSSVSQTKEAIDVTRKKGIQVSGIYFEEGDVVYGADQFKAMYGNKDAVACPLSELSVNLEAIAKRFSRS